MASKWTRLFVGSCYLRRLDGNAAKLSSYGCVNVLTMNCLSHNEWSVKISTGMPAIRHPLLLFSGARPDNELVAFL